MKTPTELIEELDSIPVGNINSHFLDSGSFSLTGIAKKYHQEHKGKDRFEWYYTKEHFDYIDAYCNFILNYREAIDLFANVDVISNPELTHRNQQYIEGSWSLTPIPVVHFKTDLSWIERYIGEGYGLIGLGGLVKAHKEDKRNWLDRVFDLVCDTKDSIPKVHLHGFGITGFTDLLRYPWHSVDSSSWAQSAAFGFIYVPHKRKGKFIFNEQPYTICCSEQSGSIHLRGKHILTLPKAEQKIVQEWLEFCGIPLSTTGGVACDEARGVLHHHNERRGVNLKFFEMLRASVPTYPWKWERKQRKTLGAFK
jgi:hypothetical protein